MEGQKKTLDRQLSKDELTDYGGKILKYKEIDPKQTSSILDILLGADLTLSLLKESKLHKIVSTLKGIFADPKDDAQIVSKSKELYKKMKTIYEGEKPGKDEKNQQGDENVSKGKSFEELKESKGAKSASTKPAVKKPEEPVTLPKLDPDIRNKYLGLIFKYLNEENEKNGRIVEKKQDIVPISGEVEAQIYYVAGSDSQKYKQACMKKLEVLAHKTNDDLRKGLLRKEISGEDFALKDAKELMSKKVLENINTMTMEAIDARISNWTAITAKISGMNQCGKCKSKRVHFYQQQTRSADEPMTSFYTCLDCGKAWKEG